MQSHLVRERRPGKGLDLQVVVQELDQLPGAGPNLPSLRRLFDSVEVEADVVDAAARRPDECCGFGGSFCVTDEAVSAKMGYDSVHDFHRHGAEYIASADMSCLLHLKGVIDRLKLPLKVIHIAQILNGGPR